ncbi:DUF3850 domain-containing protein [Vibrio sp. TRT 21S02]|uniref:DUF3850 domain-containing protein n=1 Tax=Vibrio sp. TRT 21S02 TaxID=3418507 RepID=UPI003CF02A75
MSNPKVHDLKITPDYFEQQYHGVKRFELRHNDRDYQVGDILNLSEWDGQSFTGRSITVEVTCMLTAEQFDGILDPMFVILGTSEELEVVL